MNPTEFSESEAALVAEQYTVSEAKRALQLEIERRCIANRATPWAAISEAQPIENHIVETKIDDAQGVRSQTALKRIGRMWFVPDGSMYVYYTPTHWRAI